MTDRREGGGTFGELGFRNELAKVPVAGLRSGEEGNDAAILHRNLGTDPRPESVFARDTEEARRAAYPIAVEQGHGRQFPVTRRSDEVLRVRGSAQKAERTAGV